jgi:hypothetical protein
LRARGYLPDYQKGSNSSDSAILFSLTKIAIARAEILRAKLQAEQGKKLPYEYLFFTNLDRLILSIARDHPDWKASKEVYYIQDSPPVQTSYGIEIAAGLVDHQLVLRVKNNGKRSILSREFICLDDTGVQIDHTSDALIEQEASAQITLPSSSVGDLYIIRYNNALIGVAIDQLQSTLPASSAVRT